MSASGRPTVTRRLAAIVIADVAGYSRLMERDDTGTFARLRSIRDEIVDPAIVSHDGRIVKTAGDGFLAEFPSALAALRASVQIQGEMAKRNEGVANEDRIDYRIGVNLGDVMAEKDDIAGDGVNVASRLESLAEPGGICVSGSVREQVHGQMAVAFEDIGEQRVKNIERPIRVYRVALQPNASVAMRSWLSSARRHAPVIGVLATAAVFTVAIVLLDWGGRHPPRRATSDPPAMSLAVARFTAPGDDAAASKFADALRQDVVTTLGAVEQRVALREARGESGRSADSAAQGGVVDARYILQGDVRHVGGGFGASLALVDAASGKQSWAGRFVLPDADGSDRSAIALRKLVRSVADAVYEAEKRRVVALPVDRLDADELVIRGSAAMGVATLANARKAKELYDAALRLDSNNVLALRARALIVTYENEVDPNPDPQRMAREFDEHSARALALNRTDPVSWNFRCGALGNLGQWTAAAEACDQTIKLDPYSANWYNAKAWLLIMTGRPADALVMTSKAMDLDPERPWWALDMACRAHLLLGRTRDAIETCEKASGQEPSDWNAQLFLLAAYTDAGLPEKAAAARAAVDKIVPGLTITRIRAQLVSEHPDAAALNERYFYGPLRKAGIPEK